MFRIEIAGHRFCIDNKYEYVKELCRDYMVSNDGLLTEESDTIETCICISEQEMRREADPAHDYPGSYLESTAVYRKICEHLIDDGFIMLHCSALSVDGKGLLFTAPSGTGKSTHAALWKEMLGDRAVILNDDKPLIRVDNGSVKVYGTPWSGKHSMQTNAAADVRALYILERGVVNSAEPVSSHDAYPVILGQTYRPDVAELMMKTLRLVDGLCTRIPAFRLRCSISHDAVRAAASVLEDMDI